MTDFYLVELFQSLPLTTGHYGGVLKTTWYHSFLLLVLLLIKTSRGILCIFLFFGIHWFPLFVIQMYMYFFLFFWYLYSNFCLAMINPLYRIGLWMSSIFCLEIFIYSLKNLFYINTASTLRMYQCKINACSYSEYSNLFLLRIFKSVKSFPVKFHCLVRAWHAQEDNIILFFHSEWPPHVYTEDFLLDYSLNLWQIHM